MKQPKPQHTGSNDLGPHHTSPTIMKIAIIGAGPSGCLLARFLQQSGKDIDVTIFESEGSLDFRSQGGSLDLHEKTGQASLKAAGLYDEWKKHARYDGEALKLCDKKFLCYIKQGPSKPDSMSSTGRPEIDRPVLRRVLFEGLREGTVRWGKKLTHISSENLTLYFADDTTVAGFDLIVGADGAWSKVRPLLSNVLPYYSGIAGHGFSIPDAEHTHPELYALVNRGSLFSFSDGKSINAQQMGDGSINCSTWSRREADWQRTCGYDVHDAKQVREMYRKEYAGWDPRLVAFTQEISEDHIVPRELFMLPIGHRWSHHPGVTLIGDAAHVMTPFAGEGVNLAFEDCLKLSEAIISSLSSSSSSPSARKESLSTKEALDSKIQTFEQEMFKRATARQQLTWDMLSAMFLQEGAPRKGIERYVLRALEGDLGPLGTKVATPIVYAWFFTFKLLH